ncbi:MAG TPA: PfkB family carbohydrate kinase [Tepidisphaeraceae bacterium]|nr:PfkB family carbohydrate kinase [Tepidisphaeraceae bacterium]
MSLLVTGSIGIDTIQAPAGVRPDVIGGSAVYFAFAASYFTPVRLVGVVGEDCPSELLNVFHGRPIDTAGLEVRKGSKTFRWHGKYHEDVNFRDTVKVDLGVLGERGPKVPAQFVDSQYVFLANSHPTLQKELLLSLSAPQLAVADTMDLWIDTTKSELLDLLKHVQGLVLNYEESKQLTGKTNLVAAARDVLKLGPKFCVIKKGEHGAMLCTGDDIFVMPAFPAELVVDPTGAGDSFAGGMMGYLATQQNFTAATLKRAIALGTVAASFTIEDFSLAGLAAATKQKIDQRLAELQSAMSF